MRILWAHYARQTATPPSLRADKHLLYLVSQDLLHELGQRLELRLELLELFLVVLVVDIETLFRGGLQLLALELFQLLHSVLVHGVDHVQDLEALLPEIFEERRR